MDPLRITIFGGTGFVGRHLTSRLLRAGHHVTIVARHTGRTTPLAAAEQVRLREADICNRDAVQAAMQGADAVVNLVGAVTLPGAQAYFDLHEGGACNVAREARAAGVARLLHFSALGVDAHAPSAADRSKAAGERAVREAYPEAILVRPSLVFGDDDHFFNRLAGMARISPVIPLIGATTRFQPVHVGDLAEACARILETPQRSTQIYEIGGGEIYTLRHLTRLLLAALGKKRLLVPLPYALAVPLGVLLETLPHAPVTREQVLLMRTDKVVGPGAAGLADLGVQARSLRAWLDRSTHRFHPTPEA